MKSRRPNAGAYRGVCSKQREGLVYFLICDPGKGGSSPLNTRVLLDGGELWVDVGRRSRGGHRLRRHKWSVQIGGRACDDDGGTAPGNTTDVDSATDTTTAAPAAAALHQSRRLQPTQHAATSRPKSRPRDTCASSELEQVIFYWPHPVPD